MRSSALIYHYILIVVFKMMRRINLCTEKKIQNRFHPEKSGKSSVFVDTNIVYKPAVILQRKHVAIKRQEMPIFRGDKLINSRRSAVHGTCDGSAQIIALSILRRVMRNECQCIPTALTKLLSRPFVEPFESRQCENLTPSTSGPYRIFHFSVVKIGRLMEQLGEDASDLGICQISGMPDDFH